MWWDPPHVDCTRTIRTARGRWGLELARLVRRIAFVGAVELVVHANVLVRAVAGGLVFSRGSRGRGRGRFRQDAGGADRARPDESDDEDGGNGHQNGGLRVVHLLVKPMG